MPLEMPKYFRELGRYPFYKKNNPRINYYLELKD